MTPERIAIVGAGGFAQEVRWLISEINEVESSFEFIGYLVSDLAALGPNDSQHEVLGDLSWLDENRGSVDALALGIGTPKARETLGRELERLHPELEWPQLVHPSVHYDAASCRLGRGVLLCAGTIGTVDVILGDFTMINLACTLGHGAQLGTGCVLNPTVNVSGGVCLGDRVLVGTGAQILQYVKVGDDARIGAGAVVTKTVEPGQTVVGVPARPLESRS